MPYRDLESLLLLDKGGGVIISNVPFSDGCICYPVSTATHVKQFDLR